ncbi:MAG: gliding motility-associated C-terminal domain-containing protein [Saprospiraceae bacterium]|nr:gliding motility-associated C-terminal domain-containing protein [Saprospiraceae bacterium]
MNRLFLLLLTGLSLSLHIQAQEHIPFLISNGGDFQSDGAVNIHLAIGEPVVVSSDGSQYIGLGFLQALTRSEPCPPEDIECLCARNPEDPQCQNNEIALDDVNFLIDLNNPILPPPTLQIDGTFHLTVFNRWGKQEFSTLDEDQITNWDGSDQQGLLLDNGVYFYILENPGCNGGKCKGSITILR